MTGLYIHIPFCVRKCKYCDFFSVDNGEELKDEYITALLDEAKEYKGLSCDTIFMGGGTPTSLSANGLARLLEEVRQNFDIDADVEVTCEANPGTLSREKLEVLKGGGVNRLSIGVQTFNNEELKKIGRIHTSEEADRTISLARECGFENISIDLMSALPGQSMQSFKETLMHAAEHKPEHISCYSLILEETTPLYEEYEKGTLNLPDEDTEREMYDFACEFLKSRGYEQYEISNFAMCGKQSKHNIKYWECREYVGIGAAAHSYYNGKRFFNTSDLRKYMSGEYHSPEYDELSLHDKIEEFMIMGLRMTRGVSREEFKKRFGIDVNELFCDVIKRFSDGGFLKDENGFIRLTHDGISVSNSIMCEFTDFNIKKIV